MSYIKDIKEAQGSIKVLTDVLIMEDKNKMPVIVNLSFDYYVKDSIAFLAMLLGNISEFTSQYGNHDTFKYDQEKDILTKEYKLFKKGRKDGIPTTVSFNLTKELKNELIDHIKGKYNEYVSKVERETNAKASKTKSSKQLETTKSVDNGKSTIKQQEGPINKLDTTFKSEKELEDFSKFTNKKDLLHYLDQGNGFKFSKWLLQTNKYPGNIDMIKYTLINEPIEKLNELREEYLK